MSGNEIQWDADRLRRPRRLSGPRRAGGVPTGPGQTAALPHIDADMAAIGELQACVRHLWSGLAAPSREDLGALFEVLSDAVERRETDTREVRGALQQVVLTVGTGATATLSEPARRRLAALTGIALPGPAGGGPGARG